MCGRFTLRTPLTVLARQLQIDLDDALAGVSPRYNIAPTQQVAAVRLAADGRRELAMLRWGLIPSWAKDAKGAAGMINARAESVAGKPAYRAAFKRRRCLVLADGFYEWLSKGKTKLPHLYELQGGQPFALAGLWEAWHGADRSADAPLESCAIITTEANELARAIHDRMPAILDPADYDAWLDPQRPTEGILPLLRPFPADQMTVRPVSTFVNSSRNEGPQCVVPADRT